MAIATERIMTNVRKFLIQLGWSSSRGGGGERGGKERVVADSQTGQGLCASGFSRSRGALGRT